MVIWGSAASANRASTFVVLSSIAPLSSSSSSSLRRPFPAADPTRASAVVAAQRTPAEADRAADTRLGRSAKQRHGARWEPREQAFERVVHALVHVPLEPLGPEHLIA